MNDKNRLYNLAVSFGMGDDAEVFKQHNAKEMLKNPSSQTYQFFKTFIDKDKDNQPFTNEEKEEFKQKANAVLKGGKKKRSKKTNKLKRKNKTKKIRRRHRGGYTYRETSSSRKSSRNKKTSNNTSTDTKRTTSKGYRKSRRSSQR
jgi:hypothetical protein